MSKTIKIIIVIALALLISGCSSKKAKIQENTYDTLTNSSETLSEMVDLCYKAIESNNYSTMEDALSDIALQCEQLKNGLDNISHYYREQSYD